MARVNVKDIEVPKAYDSARLAGMTSANWARVHWASENTDFNSTSLTTGFWLIPSDAIATKCQGLPEGALAGTVFAGTTVGNRSEQIYVRYKDGAMFVKGSGISSNTSWKQATTS